jgi:hypothetical protein
MRYRLDLVERQNHGFGERVVGGGVHFIYISWKRCVVITGS